MLTDTPCCTEHLQPVYRQCLCTDHTGRSTLACMVSLLCLCTDTKTAPTQRSPNTPPRQKAHRRENGQKHTPKNPSKTNNKINRKPIVEKMVRNTPKWTNLTHQGN